MIHLRMMLLNVGRRMSRPLYRRRGNGLEPMLCPKILEIRLIRHCMSYGAIFLNVTVEEGGILNVKPKGYDRRSRYLYLGELQASSSLIGR